MIKNDYLELLDQDAVALMRQAFPDDVALTDIRGIVQQPSGSWVNIATGAHLADRDSLIEDALRRLHERPYLLIVNRTREVTFFSELLERIPSLAGTHQTVIYHPLSEENGDFACLLSA